MKQNKNENLTFALAVDRADKLPDAFEAAVMHTLKGVFPFGQQNRVTVALSGGADSMALCHFLASHAAQLGISVTAAHLNHGLRGQESDADEAFVRQFCGEMGIPLICEHLSFAEGVHPSEAVLREKRYTFLQKAAGEGWLATGHTLTDSCETLLFHLARGTRLGGMRGIPVQRGNILRPLATLSRADTETYCTAQGLHWVTDSSNLTETYARNRIRHHCMPALRTVNPKAEQALGAWMQEAAELYDWLDRQAQEALFQSRLPSLQGNSSLRWNAERLAALPDVVLRQALASVLSPYADCSDVRLKLAAQVVRNGGALEWCRGVRLRQKSCIVWLEVDDTSTEEPGENPASFCVTAMPGCFNCGNGIRVEIREEVTETENHKKVQDYALSNDEKDEKNRKINKKDLNNKLDYDKIASMLFLKETFCADDPAGEKPWNKEESTVPLLRFRAARDTFSPGRGRGTKSLKKWFNEIACPPAERGRLPLIAVGSRVVWLAGSGAADGFAATEQTRKIWEVSWETSTTEESKP